MKKLVYSIIGMLAISAVSLAADYKIDVSHSNVNFKVKHLAISTVNGRFSDFTGSFQFDPANMKDASGTVTIDINSIDTDIADRDKHLRSADFFDAETYPQMTFQSTGVQVVDEENFKLTGNLTMRGVTKPVTLDVVYNGMAKDPWGNTRVGFTAEGKLNRKDFGLTWNKLMETGGLVVGEEIRIIIEIQAIQEKPSEPKEQ